MSVKIALLKSGEDIISDIQEMVLPTDTGEKVVGYFFNKPCILNARSPEIVVETDEAPVQNKLEVKLTPWILFSKDEKIPVPADWVVTLVTPIDQVKNMYENQVLNCEKKND